MLNIFWVLRNLGYRDWGKGYKFNHCPTFWGFISDMGCLRELEKVLSFHFESWEKGMFLIKSVVVIKFWDCCFDFREDQGLFFNEFWY